MKFHPDTVLKAIREDETSNHRFPLPGRDGLQWPLPIDGKPGEWVGPVCQDEKKIKPHSWGIHLATPSSLIYWQGERLFIAEYKGDHIRAGDTVVAQFARLKQEICIPGSRIVELAVDFCAQVVDLPRLLEFDWTVGRNLRLAFDMARLDPRARAALTLADLCEKNARMRRSDAQNSFQYVYGCQAVEHVSSALAKLPRVLPENDAAANVPLLKAIAYECRQAISLAVEQNAYRADINGFHPRPLPPRLARWVAKASAGKSPHHRAQIAMGEWQNKRLLKALQIKK